MGKKITFLILFFFTILLICCSSQKEADNKIQQEETELQVASGMIMVVGNAPFTKLAVLVNDSTSYILSASKEIEKELKANQGKFYKIIYKENSTKDKTIDVINVENINK